ncbi:GNAT family N-acetyltransferase [Nonomuraea sp. NPDC050790]|uniref:GNAT family N-acetyltransferase n=1 Tax=Nonomuraea sp. NPDC050790 TaxID=3364371 RepID=UPI0037930010
MYPVYLPSKKVVLREFRQDDAEAAFHVVGDSRVTDWLSFDARSHEQATDMVAGIVARAQDQPRTEYYLAITTHESDSLIGFVRLGLSGVQAAKLGFAITADAWGHGYATDAARTLTTFAFRSLDLHRVSAAIGPTIRVSMLLVTKLGFVPEGRIRDHVFTNGAWRDSVLYSVLNDEWSG